MASTISDVVEQPQVQGTLLRTVHERLTVAGSTTWAKFQNCQIIAQMAGTATTATAIVERSVTDPAGMGASAAPADTTSWSGDLTSGVSPLVFEESGVAWWRIRATTVTGGYIDATLSGIGA